MPELPEVETVRVGLQRLLPGRFIAAIDFDWPKGFPNAPSDVTAFLVGSKIIAVRRRAKVLMVDLSTNYSLVIHLKMTGQLVFVPAEQKQGGLGKGKKELGATAPLPITQTPNPPAEGRFGAGHPNESLIGKLPDKSTRVTITFKDASRLYFNDQRKFGWVRLMPTIEIPNIDFMQKVGPEPLSQEFTAAVFIERVMRRKNSNIKAVLLDQTVLAGVGNIYADESLFAAKIHPTSITGAIPKSKLTDLHHELVAVLKLSIEKGGSTDRNYVNAEGKKGSYIDFAKVFRREKQPCYVCGHEILKSKVAGRGTHTCEYCQKKYEVKK
jgi:formamidopyrimidine-DNA glycosylase